jgi:DNA-binding MarR family transcriptional regulator
MVGKGRPKDLARHVKTNRAFRAYIDLTDAADWLRGEMSDQLASFDLTMMQFRVLEALFCDGPQYQQLLSQKFDCSKQNIAEVLKGLQKWGAVRSDRCRLPSRPTDEVARAAWKRAGLRWQGRWISLVTLTPAGKKFVAHVIEKHKKVVKAWMRVLDAREQRPLSRLCRRLRTGDVVKFVKDIRWWIGIGFMGRSGRHEAGRHGGREGGRQRSREEAHPSQRTRRMGHSAVSWVRLETLDI